MNSMPLKKRMVFDGVHVPTLRKVMRRWEMVQRAETSKNAVRTEQGLVSAPHTPSSRSAQRKSRISPFTLPSSVGSDEDNFDWEDFYVDVTSPGKCNFCIELDIHLPSPLYPEVDVDQFLVSAHPSSPLSTQASTPHGTPEYHRVGRLTQLNHQSLMTSPIFPLD